MFKYLISVEPLGLLYGSAGRFLSPENLVGRSGQHFPPSAATLSGLFAAQYGNNDVQTLQVAGPFWGDAEAVEDSKQQDFYVPAPYHYLVGDTRVEQLYWYPKVEGSSEGQWLTAQGRSPSGKYKRDYWVSLREWNNPKTFKRGPWEFVPHLHPRLQHDQRKVAASEAEEGTTGSLFLENGVQLNPEARLVYLSNMELPSGWYRFGGEGHMVDVATYELSDRIQKQLSQPVGSAFATIVPAVWGSNRLSLRWPSAWDGSVDTVMTARPEPFRYRLGGKKGETKRLSRGRYAVPAGSVYIRKAPLNVPWYDWKAEWFPKEGPRLNRWGCGLSLPLSDVVRTETISVNSTTEAIAS